MALKPALESATLAACWDVPMGTGVPFQVAHRLQRMAWSTLDVFQPEVSAT